MSPSTLRAVVLAVLAAVFAASCGNNDTTTTPTTTEDIRNTEIFSATLSVGQSQFYSFTTISPGTTDVTLISLRPAGSISSTLSSVVGIGLGTPQGTDCALSSALNTTPGLKAQLTATTNVSVYCVKIADIGNLTGTVDYTVRVVHP
jgi:hypothetical protein